MRRLIRTAGLAALLLAGAIPCAHPQGAAKRQYKDQGEYDLVAQAVRGDAGDPAVHIRALNAWARQYPDSDFKDERSSMLALAYNRLTPPQPAKVLEYASEIVARDLKTVFDDTPSGAARALQFLYVTTGAAGMLPNPTAAQADTGWVAAQKLQAGAAAFFAPANKPASTSGADWDQQRATMVEAADHTLMMLEIYQAEAVLARRPQVPADCRDIAEPAYQRALVDFPLRAYVSYKLAQALQCQQAESPGKISLAVYEYQRAAVIDPTLGGAQPDAAIIPEYADKAYILVHGSADGLNELKRLVKRSALPPEGFRIMTAHEAAGGQ